jgi:hypothetical protein
MSTSPDTSSRAGDHLVAVLSQWLAGHVRDDELLEAVERVSADELSADQSEAVAELLTELRDPNGHAGELNMLARETIQALCFG